jgi:hypothetical protein
MKYWAEFYEGQYTGRHWFATKKSRAEFIGRAIARGVDVSGVKQGEK